jgi:hypothetical protein
MIDVFPDCTLPKSQMTGGGKPWRKRLKVAWSAASSTCGVRTGELLTRNNGPLLALRRQRVLEQSCQTYSRTQTAAERCHNGCGYNTRQ